MMTTAMHESNALLDQECVTTVIRNPLLRLGLERVLDDLGLTSITHHDGSVGFEEMSSTDLLIAELSMISADQLRRAHISAVIIVREDEIEALSEVAELPSCAFALEADISPGLLADLALKALAGETAVSPVLGARVLAHLNQTSRRRTTPVSPQEGKVLLLLADGLSNKQIARRIGISEHGVKRLVANLLIKFDGATRTEVVAKAMREGLLEALVPTIA
jgi:two-component system nitrate/nitrite response regulator NarL